MKNKYSVLLLLLISVFSFQFSIAQTAKVYRGGLLLSTHSTLSAACSAANTIGDSILISAHTFFEHNIPAQGGQTWQGTYTPTDSTIIDAQSMGRVFSVIPAKKSRAINIRNIICQNGRTIYPQLDGGGINHYEDSVVLRGNSIVRHCRASRNGGGIVASACDNVLITNNIADSIGGGASNSVFWGNVLITSNEAKYGGGSGDIVIISNGVVIKYNIASVAGGGIFGDVYSSLQGYQVLNNQSPRGAGICGKYFPSSSVHSIDVRNAYIYNPAPDGSRQNEIYLDGGGLGIDGCWFGKSDTTGLIIRSTAPHMDYGKYATTSWSVNRGVPITAKDTLFPIGAAFVYNDGTPMPPNACPWLVGKFSASVGTMISPNPTVNAKDTMSSMFRTYAYTVGGSGSKAIDFLCIVDEDTFRVTKPVWGRTPLGIKEKIEDQSVMVFPNPAKDYLNINGLTIGSEVALYDLAGHLMKNEKVKMNNIILDIKNLPAGTYILKITTAEGREGSARVIVD